MSRNTCVSLLVVVVLAVAIAGCQRAAHDPELAEADLDLSHLSFSSYDEPIIMFRADGTISHNYDTDQEAALAFWECSPTSTAIYTDFGAIVIYRDGRLEYPLTLPVETLIFMEAVAAASPFDGEDG